MDHVTLIDTDILIDAGRGVSDAVSLLERIEIEGIPGISVITQMELIIGCQSKQELYSVERFVRRFEVFRLTEQISTIAVELLRQYRLSHGLLIADALIAATASHFNVPFVSKNQKDYRFIPNLRLLEYP